MRICVLTQQAFAAYLEDQSFASTIAALEELDIDSLPIVTGIENETAIANENSEAQGTLPRIICECNRATPQAQNNGNWTASARVILETQSNDTTETDNATLCAAIGNLIETTTIAADISAAITGYTALCVRFSSCGYEIDGRVWRSHWDFEIDCCASDIS